MDEQSDIGRLVLGRYRIVRRIARGGMGTIDLARSEGAAGFARPVVVKRIRPGSLDEDTATRLFTREARIMAHLRHPNVVDVIDFAHDEDGYTLVMDYVHGYHLAKWCYYVRKTSGRFPVGPAVEIVASTLDALSHAHGLEGPDGTPLRVVHRDVKPANILIDVDGHVVLTDFGIAQMTTDETVSSGQQAAVRGTFPYMPPELFSSAEPSPASDTYACAVVLHEALAGKNEFRVKDVSVTVARVLNHRPTRLDTLRHDVPPAVADVVDRALAKDPAERYPDAAALAEALREARGEGTAEARRALAERARADFREPAFARVVGTEELDTLDRAWREEVPAPAETEDPQWLEPTRVAPPPGAAADADGAGARGRGWWRASLRVGLLAALGAVVVGAGLAAWAWSRGEDVRYIVTSGDVEREGEGAVVGAGSQAGEGEGGEDPVRAGAPAEPEPGARAPDAGARGADARASGSGSEAERDEGERGGAAAGEASAEEDPARALTRAFRARTPSIRRCVDAHAEDAEGAPELSVRFRVDAGGEILDAALLPEAAMATSLGSCVLAVAEETDFEPPGETLTIRIPIAVSARR